MIQEGTTHKVEPTPSGPIELLLHAMAGRRASPWPVLSVYLNTRPAAGGPITFRPFLKKALAEALAALPERSPEHDSLRVDIERVQHYLDYDLADATRAVALFACFGEDDWFEALQLPVPLAEPSVRVAPLPLLWPLLDVADRAQRVAVLLGDSHTARLFVLSLGRIEIRREVRSPLAERPPREGEAPHSPRHADEARKKHARLAVATLEELARDAGAAWTLVAGEAVVLPDLEAALSHALRSRLLARPETWDVRLPEAELAARVDERVEARAAAARRALAEAVSAPVAGRSVLGLADTIAALRAVRVAELVLSSAFPADRAGWSCSACHALGEGDPADTCPECGRATLSGVILREELAHRALAAGALVRFVEPLAVPAFDATGGVGATLRYA